MDYIINLNKPRGITSHDAVQKVKSILSLFKAGHAGTLDPVATGVLLICCNMATRISGYLSELDKEYIVTMRLGFKTDTMDTEGTITKKMDTSFVTESMIEGVLKEYTGTILQTPPMFSAIKHKGVPLYKLARKGISLKREKRPVHIYSIELMHFENPFLTLRVSCSKGTYIRSLGNDIAESAGTYGHVFSLKRTKVGKYNIHHSVDINDLENLPQSPRPPFDKGINPPHSFLRKGGLRGISKEGLRGIDKGRQRGDLDGFYSIDDVLSHLRELPLSPEETTRVLTGRIIRNMGSVEMGNSLRLKNGEGMLIGIGISSNKGIKMSKSLINIPEYLKMISTRSI